MKKHLILVGVFSVAIVQSQPAMAVTKCVALNSRSTTCAYASSEFDVTDWTTTCTTNDVSIPIKGIGICVNASASALGTTTTQLELSSTADDNKYCWCRMISPAVSRWVYVNSTPTAGDCHHRCASYCAAHVRDTPLFRRGMFGSLSD